VTITAPEPLSDRHQIGEFASGVASLDDWLKRRASKNQAADASRTFVAVKARKLSAITPSRRAASKQPRRRATSAATCPNRFRVVVLGRLAVDHGHKGQGLGRALFRDGAKRVLHAADSIGIRGILVHAISEDAKAFYLALGFETSPLDPMTLMVTLADLRRAV